MASNDVQDAKKAACDHVEVSKEAGELNDIPGEVIIEAERAQSVLVNARKHWRVLLISCVSFTAAVTFGFDVVITTASLSMPSFLLYFGEMGPTGPFLPSIWTSLWTAMSALMQAVGSIAIGSIVDRYGRKWPACAASALTLVGTAVQYTAKSRGALLGGKMISGLGIGAIVAVGVIYLAEIAPVKLRAPLQSSLIVFILIVQGLALGVIRILVPDVRERAFRIAIAIQWPVGLLGLVAWALAPESPKWLVRHEKIQRATKVMKALYGPHDAEERLDREVYFHQAEVASQSVSAGVTWASLCRGSNFKRTITVAFLYSTANVGGGPFLAQNIYFLITAGLAAIHSFDVGIGGFALAVVFILSSGLFLQRISRRNVVISALAINLVVMTVIGALYYVPGHGALWGIAILMNVLISLQASLLQGVGWPIAAEIPSATLKAKTLSIGVCSQTFSTWLFQFITPYMYNVDSGNLGARTGFIYAGTSAVLFVVAWLLVPDTTVMTQEEVDEAYEIGVSPRKFQKHVKQVRLELAGESNDINA